MVKYFITGGAGFIGSHLTEHLLKNEHKVTVYDNFASGKHEFISQHQNNPNFKLIQGDLLNNELLQDSIKSHDFIFHLAANPDIRKSTENTKMDIENNILATYNLLDAMRQNNIQKIAFTSSSTVYGETTTMPTPENHGPLLPISLYGASKLAGEALISAYCGSFNLQAYIFRFANIIGSRGTHGIIYDFIQKLKKNKNELEILGDGKQSKSYLLVDDCIDAMQHIIKHADEKINIYNLSTEDSTQVTTIAKIVTEELGLNNTRLKYTGGTRGWTGDIPRFLLSIEKLKNIGWEPKNTSDEAVRKATRTLIRELWK